MSNIGIEDVARVISALCGWLYFLAWSVSFYPQLILNIRRKTTQGLTPDFPLLNVLGFSCYTITTVAFLFSPVIRSQYAERHPKSPEPTVRMNDLAFGLHALALCFVTYSQFWPRLWGWEHQPAVRRHANKVTLGLIWGGIIAIAIILVVVLAGGDGSGQHGMGWAWIDVIYATSYVKLVFTVFKYIPQVLSNFKRRSTIGWSITQQLLDLTGGILSLLQLIIDSWLQSDWSGLTGNPVKLGLANVSVAFDLISVVQHFVLYGPVEERDDGEIMVDGAHGPRTEREPLLTGEGP